MAFRMNPKSPLLMKAMGTASPAKNMNKGYGPAKTSSPAKQTAKQKANLPKEIVKAIAAKSPAKQKEQDPTQIPGNQVRAYSKGGSIRAPKVSYDMAYEKRDKKKYNMSKADYIKEAKRQTKSKLDTNDWDANQRKKTKATTTLKAEGVKNTKTDMPAAKAIKAKAIKVASKTAAKPTRSQKIRAKGEAALASGNTSKAQRLRRRYDRVEARKAKSDETAAKGKKSVDEGKDRKADRLLKRAARQENRSIKKEKRQAGRAAKKAAKA